MASGAPAAKKRPKKVRPAKAAGPALDWGDIEDDVTSVLGTGVSIPQERLTGEPPSSKTRGPVSEVTLATEDKPGSEGTSVVTLAPPASAPGSGVTPAPDG